MSLIADGLLIATCLTAALYCYVLSRRLKQFTSTEDGVGKQVRDLNVVLEETRAALKETQAGAAAASEALAAEIAAARKLSTQLRNLCDEAEGAVERTPPPVQGAPVEPVREAAPEPAPAAPTKLEAVKHTDSPAPAPARAAVVDDFEDEEEDLSELNLEDVLQATPGEQQLGFLPDDDEEDEEPEFKPAVDVQQPGDAEPVAETLAVDDPGEPALAPDEADEAPAATGGAATAKTENLLKVERMAL